MTAATLARPWPAAAPARLPWLSGVLPLLVTPFRDDAIDDDALRRLVRRQTAEGCTALVAGSDVGEGPTLRPGEPERLVRICIEAGSGRVPVLAGLCGSGTAKAVELALAAKAAGAEGLVVATPPYSRPTQDGIVQHVRAVAAASRLPVIVRDQPGETRIELRPETLLKLASIEGVVAIAGGSGLPESCPRLAWLCEDRCAPAPAWMRATGWLSAAANLVPADLRRGHVAHAGGDWNTWRGLVRRLDGLAAALALEPPAATLKFALSRRDGGFPPATRLPLCPLAPATEAAVEAALHRFERESDVDA